MQARAQRMKGGRLGKPRKVRLPTPGYPDSYPPTKTLMKSDMMLPVKMKAFSLHIGTEQGLYRPRQDAIHRNRVNRDLIWRSNPQDWLPLASCAMS